MRWRLVTGAESNTLLRLALLASRPPRWVPRRVLLALWKRYEASVQVEKALTGG